MGVPITTFQKNCMPSLYKFLPPFHSSLHDRKNVYRARQFWIHGQPPGVHVAVEE